MAVDFDSLVLGPCQSIFGHAVVLIESAAVPVSLPDGTPKQPFGIFTDEPVIVDTGTGIPHSTTQPTLGLRRSDWLVMPTVDEVIQVRGKNYEIADTQPDAEGDVKLILKEPVE